MTYTRDTDAIDVKALAYLNRADKTAFQDTAGNDYTSAFRDEQFKGTQTWGADLQATLFDLKPLQLTVGASFKEARFRYREEYRTSDRDAGAKGVQQTLSPFANLDFRFLDENLILNLGARYDHIKTSDGKNRDTRAGAGKPAYSNTYDSVSEGSFSPKLGVAFHPDNKTTLRVSGGKGFRAPSLFELYKVHVRQGGAYYREANPDLKPEEIWSWDIGAERFLTDRLWARTAFYQSFARDYIGDRLVGTGTFSGSKTRYEYVLDNIGKVDIHGIEAELQWWPVNDIMLFTNYAWNISKVKEDTENADLEGNYLPNDPRHNVHAGFRYQNPRIANVSLIANYYSVIYFNNENTLRENSYFTLDASISRKFIDMITVYVNAENIFDKRYPMFRSASSGDTIAPGVIVAGGVKFEF